MFLFFFIFPCILVINCFFIFLFKKYLGPVGIFYTSLICIFLSITALLVELFYNFVLGTYFYIDFGRWFFINNLIDSRLLFCFDNLAIITSILVLILTSLAQLFGVEYMIREAFINRLVYLLNMFSTSVVLLFCIYDFFLIMIFWEFIGFFSFLLVNYYSQRIYTIKASYKTFLFSRISDMFMFFAFSIVVLVFETTDLSLIFLQIPFYLYHFIFIGEIGFNFLTIFSMLLALSGCVKAAQFFTHVWLPDAMEAPTPASALIHSSTLVIMGVYTIIRCSIIFEFAPITNYFLALWGSTTIAYGAVVACFQTDIKKLVAYSTISQIGYLICGCGFCAYEEVIFYLTIHALNKAFLFIVVGYTVHFFNSDTDFRQMSTIYMYSKDISLFFLTTSINLIGLPYSAGFYSKEFLLFQIIREGFVSYFIRSFWFISFIFTPLYMFLLCFYVSFYFRRSLYSLYKLIINNQLNLNNFFLYIKYKFILYIKYKINLFTSRFTVYILWFFWFLFLFFGEHLILIMFNYSSSTNFINNNFFNNYNFFFSYNTNIFNSLLSNFFFYLIVFFTTNSIIFLYSLIRVNFSRFIKYSFTLDYINFFISLVLVFTFL